MRTKLTVLSQVFLSLIFLTPSLASSTLTLSTFAGPPLSNNNGTGFYDLILHEAFKRIGYQIETVHLPAERSLANANSGVTDGDFVRVEDLEHQYPELIRVPEKITDFEFVAFTRHVSEQTTSWDMLRPYNVAIVRGWKILEENIVGTKSLVRTDNQDQLFNLLVNDRADIIVYSRFEGYAFIHSIRATNILALEPPLARKEMFLYLNRKHQILIGPLVSALRDMKKDGTYSQIRIRVLGPYLPGSINER